MLQMGGHRKKFVVTSGEANEIVKKTTIESRAVIKKVGSSVQTDDCLYLLGKKVPESEEMAFSENSQKYFRAVAGY